ncbi:hypothetical protein V1264_023874 [Littorina saxatilis]|uniref:A disintegrin and metalloproteinase with thrombospondin motifs 6 n=2 Tax=Littorina saxatilis TaxID=31220 RepID=A0AAN9GA92_9CAEN
MFSTDVDDYFVEPLWNHTRRPVDRLGGRATPHPHIVYSRSSIKNTELHTHCGVSDYQKRKYQWLKHKSPATFNEVLKPRRRMRMWRRLLKKSKGKGRRKAKVIRRHRRPRSVSNERHVETLVVVDKKMVDYYQHHHNMRHPDGLTAYVLTIMNIVAKLFHDPSIGNAINIVVTKLIIFTGDADDTLPQISYHADKSLDSFCRWQHRLLGQTSSGQGRASHDNAVLLTRYDICTYKNEPCGTLGLAPVEGMCEKERSCSINQDIGLASAFIIAHEIGHNFGMHHDGAGNTCGLPGQEPARIMAARLTKDTSPFQWSSCSRAYITDFLDAGKGWCLDNIPLKREAYPQDVPGEDFDIDTQCRHQFGPRSRACKIKKACRELWCVNNIAECVTNSIPAAEGTECFMSRHKKGWCHLGECRNPQYEARTVHGSWGQWDEWGDCSRTCGGGVEASQRQCDDPVPKDGGRYCVGLRKRYRSCNVTPCGADARDFREVQCSSYDNVPFRGRYYKWIPYTGEQAKPCALVCMAEGYNFYTERVSKVIDGTRCYPDKPHICINGECKFVGCDGYLGSRKKEDVCRVCAGDNSTCRTVSGFFDKPLPKGAYQEIVTIPRGAIHLQVAEAAFSSNYLALRNDKDEYYINGDWTIDWPRKFSIAGTVFHYKLVEYEPESFQALGPTSEDLVVMMLLQEENRGIQYQYNLPVNGSGSDHDISLYTWRHAPWSPCTKSCSTGLSVSKAQCVNKSDDSVVEDAYCRPQPRPSDHNKHCNLQSCPPEWSMGQWSECSQTCGEGVRTRHVVCTQVTNEGEVVQDDSQCRHGNKPTTHQDCSLQRCPAVWHTFEWSLCAPSCGPGEKTRRVVCMTSDSNTYVDDALCQETKEVKPATRQSCINRRCPPPQWRKGEWGQCSVSCGTGKQERSVQCQSFNGQPCDPALRPPALQDCSSPCSEQPDLERCEDKFKVAYCPLVFNFGYCERPYFQTMCCETCSKEGTPPPMPRFPRRRRARG